MRRISVFLGAGMLAVGLSSCGSASAAERPEVVATVYPAYEAVARLGGSLVHASNILPIDPYGAVSTEKAEQLQRADLVVTLGAGVQPEVDKALEGRTGPVVRVLGDFDVHAAGFDPSVWLDPARMMAIIEMVRDGLNALVPDHTAVFARNAVRYGQGLASIDRAYAEMIATCSRRTILVETPRFSALAKRYGLRQVTVGSLVGASRNDQAARAIEDSKATTVFADTQPSLKEAGRILDEYGVRVAVLDTIATQTDQARRGGATYESVMGINADALRFALGCEPKRH